MLHPFHRNFHPYQKDTLQSNDCTAKNIREYGSTILSLYGRKRVSENLYSRIFYAVLEMLSGFLTFFFPVSKYNTIFPCLQCSLLILVITQKTFDFLMFSAGQGTVERTVWVARCAQIYKCLSYLKSCCFGISNFSHFQGS